MPSNGTFTTSGAAKQQEIIAKLIDLFKGNERFHGAGDVVGARFEEDKNKWKPGNTRAVHTKLTEADWHAHLSGQRFIGISPLLDDGTVWFTCMDVDRMGEKVNYDFDYEEEMGKIKRSGLPLVVYRTKSGGLRVTIFFSEPVEAEIAVRRMQQISAQLGYAPCEIFPKQFKVNDPSRDFPAWIFLPYGPSPENMFPEQCCMNESGNPMPLYESVVHAMRKRITKKQFFDLFVVEMNARANGKANGKTRPKGMWTEEKDYETTWYTTFTDGPICLWHIAQWKCREFQHNFLLNCASFFIRKYPENWEHALKWVNRHVLIPEGDPKKYTDLVNSLKKKEHDHYEYTCKNEPICSHCNAKACKKQPYGVGVGNGVDYFDLAITVYNSKPQVFFTNVGEDRISCSADQLLNLNKYRTRCLEYSLSFPDNMAKKDWDRVIKNSLENATIVDPPEVFKTDAKELMILESWLSVHIRSGIRRNYGEFMEGKWGEAVRVREDEKRIYFKAKKLFTSVRLQRGPREEDIITYFVGTKCMEHRQGPGARDWFRYTYSIGFDQFDEETLQKWFDPDKEGQDGQ